MSNKMPTFQQQWILCLSNDDGLLYAGALYGDSLSPFRGDIGCTIRNFLKRMEKGGWLIQATNPSFYRLSEKSILWRRDNPDKSPLWYRSERERKWREKAAREPTSKR
jgi:DNA-binding transcriptional regulator PaaX